MHENTNARVTVRFRTGLLVCPSGKHRGEYNLTMNRLVLKTAERLILPARPNQIHFITNDVILNLESIGYLTTMYLESVRRPTQNKL